MEKKTVNEIFFLRAIACLSIVILHSLTMVYDDEGGIIQYIKLLLSFGTPTFIFISELLLAYAYAYHTPKGFLKKRVRYILIPFIFFAFVYAIQEAHVPGQGGFLKGFAVQLGNNLFLGEFPGYFILIIFQFYLLHLLFQRYIFHKFKPRVVLLMTGAINIAYLAFFNFTKPINNEIAIYFWDRLYRMPFPGWLFYFAVAYYCGRNLNAFKNTLNRFRVLIMISVPLSALLMIISLQQGWILAVSSKRVDMIFFTLSMVFFLTWLSSRMKQISPIWIIISQYSFGIYLVHQLINSIIVKAINPFGFWRNNIFGVLLLFICMVSLSIAFVHILNRYKWGSYVVGRIGIGRGSENNTNPILQDQLKNEKIGVVR